MRFDANLEGNLWPERIVAMADPAKPYPLTLPPSWRKIESEAAVIRAAIEAGQAPWPPSLGPVDDVNRKRWIHVPKAFDPHHLLCYSVLPSIASRADASFAQLRQYMPHDAANEAVRTEVVRDYAMSLWLAYGRWVYVLSDNTFDLLAYTDLPKMPWRYLRAPRHAFYVRFPSGVFYFDVGLDEDPQPVEGAMVAFSALDGEDGQVREMNILVVGKGANPEDDNCYYVSIVLEPEKTLDTVGIETDPARKGAYAIGYLTPRTIVGLLLYLMSEHPVLERVPAPARRDLAAIRNPGKRRKAEALESRTNHLAYYWVGDPANTPLPERIQGPPSPGMTRTLDHEVWVTGHWKLQPYGPRNALRKVIWIKPYRKGPDHADTIRLRVARVREAQPRPTR